MSELVLEKRVDSIAILQLNNPPVNGLGQPLRISLLKAFTDAVESPSVKAIIIHSAGSVFCGGADINEFANGTFNSAPFLPDILDIIEESQKPVIAAISGVALGGGLELSMACDYRIATESARLGLPEVSLGLIPGAGGTQRLPRLTGADKALEMIISGTPVSAGTALSWNLLDAVISSEDDLLTEAVKYANELTEKYAPVKSCADSQVDENSISDSLFSNYLKQYENNGNACFAEQQCIKAVQAACKMDLKTGIAYEAELFNKCLLTPQSKAKQYLFFAERASAKLPAKKTVPPGRKLAKITVVGATSAGEKITRLLATAGTAVSLLGASKTMVNDSRDIIEHKLNTQEKSESEILRIMSLISVTEDFSNLSDCDLIIDASESGGDSAIGERERIFNQYCSEDAIIAVVAPLPAFADMAQMYKKPEQLIALNGFDIASNSGVIEIGSGEQTSGSDLLSVARLFRKAGMVPVFVNSQTTFISNCLLAEGLRTAIEMIRGGTKPGKIDESLEHSGFKIGLCALLDQVGIDTLKNHRSFDDDDSYNEIEELLIKNGCFGISAGEGIYSYCNGVKSMGKTLSAILRTMPPQPDLASSIPTAEEITQTFMYNWKLCADRMMTSNIALRSSDIDLLSVRMLGFPRWFGGPVHYAQKA